jgi:hypothetical protein
MDKKLIITYNIGTAEQMFWGILNFLYENAELAEQATCNLNQKQLKIK